MADEPQDDRTKSFVALSAGTLVSHYKIINKIGAGGMGEVYLAQDTQLDRKVALKFLPPHLCQDEECRARFKREAQAAAKLDHPNIATIHEVGEHQSRPYFSMQVVEGQSLRDVIKGKDMPIARIIEIGIQVCEGLQTAHEEGVIHRDIKPSNILIDAHGRVRIVDFGLAAVRGADHLTRTGSTLGTIGYMSPEQVQGKEADHRSDLFSLGVVLYELITKQNPFRRDSEAATLKAVSDDVAEPLSRYKRDIPELLESITTKLLEKNPAHRYQTAIGVSSDLQRLKQEYDGRMITGPAVKTPKKPMHIALPIIIVLLVAAVLVLKPWKFDISPDQVAVAAEDRLAIMYFDNLNDPDDSLRLGEIVTNLLITDLSESRYVNVVSSQRLYDILRQLGYEGERKINRSVATQVARKAGARWMLLGSILNTEPDIVLAAQLVEVATGDAFASQRVEGQPGERIFSVVDELTAEIRQDLSLPSEAAQERDPEIAEMTTDSPEAFRYYLEGQTLFRQHLWTEAAEAFSKALGIDSTFSLAHYGLAHLSYWLNDPQARTHIANALKYADRVSQKGRYYIDCLAARLDRDIPRAVGSLEKMIDRYPDEKDAYVSLGLIARVETKDVEKAITYFEKVVELDPFHGEALNQLAYCHNDLGRFDKAMEAVNKYIEVLPDEANPYDSRGEILAMNGRLDEAIASYEKATELVSDFARPRLADLYLFREDFAKADSLHRAMLSDPDESTRSDGRLALTRIPRYQGRFKEALSVLDIGIATDRMELGVCQELAQKFWKRALINEFIGKQETVIEDLMQAIDIMRENEARDLYLGLYQAFLAAELAESGNKAGTDELMHEIAESIMKSGYADSSHYWIALANTAFKQHKYDTAVVYWEKIVKLSPFHFSSLQSLGMSYLSAGRLGDAVIALEKAVSIYDKSRDGAADMGVSSHYYLARAYEASGWTDQAIVQYETFLRIWKNADPEIEEISDARSRLDRLKSRS